METASGKKLAVEKIYQKKTQLEHILLRPDTYVGSMERLEQEMWIWDFNTEQMVKKEIKFVPGLFKIFDEILVNAADNKVRDPGMTVLKVNIDKESNMIKVYNNGKGIPVVEHKDEKMYVPSLIFGHLLTSSNYNDDEKKVTGGRNGYGAKLCNIFSKKFIVETSCKESKKYFKQTWTDNMSKTNQPTIKDNKDEDFTSITFYPDLVKFGMGHLEEDTVKLLARRAYDVAASTRGVKVYLNDKRLPISKFEDYCKLYVVNNTGSGDGDILNSSLNGTGAKIFYESCNPRWEVAVSYSDIGFQQVSFVNSIATTKGGRHVDYVCDQLTKSLTEVINKKSGKNSTNIKPFQIKNHIWLFVNCLIENPVFESQTKECMSLQVKNFGSKCTLSDEFLKKIAARSGIVDRVLNWLAFKEKHDLEKTGSKSKQSKIKGIAKLDDANNAGTKDSMNCTLILTEGDSAKTLAVAGLGVIGRDRYGVFPLRGKMLNVREATTKQILENAEITSVCKIIGLNFKEKYETKDSMKSLRYGKIMIMTDQDHDGSHIKGLIINFIHFQWPNLLKHGFIDEFITPIIKVTKSSKKSEEKAEKSFYSMPEFNEWQNATPDWHTWKVKYYKGLGTSTSKEAKEYFSDMNRHCIRFEHSGVRDDLAIQLAFSKKLAEDRKEWLTKFMEKRNQQQMYLYQKDTKKINYTEFVNKELVLFSNLDNERSIPSLVDGFKPGQRKVLFACFKRNLQKEIKVAQLAGSVAELSAYHHGEQSLMGTIINLAQNFVGSNNLNILLPIGQFGTRLHGGKDAASPRYIFTNLSPLTRLLFNQKDDPLFDYVNDDGQRVEPDHYCPILPMILVNGAEGIGTGWASKIPNYDVRALMNNLTRIITNEEPVAMIPYYKNFRGTIEAIDETKFLVSGEVALIEDEEDKNEKNDYTVEISELPVGTWTQVYKEQVLEIMLHGHDTPANNNSGNKAPFVQQINDYKEYHTECTVRFLVKMSSKQFQYAMDQGGLHKFFKLQKTISLNNMVLFDTKGCLKRYESPLEILREFCEARSKYYVKRKAYIVDMLGAESSKLNNIARFIVEKIEGKIKVENLRKKDLINLLAEKGYDSDPVRKWKEKITKERGYLHDAVAPAESQDMAMDAEDTSKNDYNYLLSMPLWNLTLEKKEEILRQQREKSQELNNIKVKTPDQLWLDDLDEFKVELEKVEAQEKEDMQMTVRKSLKNQDKHTKSSSGFNVNQFLKRNLSPVKKYEYLPSSTGERVVPKIDTQLIDKCIKEAQQKEITKAKKDDDSQPKVLSLVDAISAEANTFTAEEMKQITEMAEGLANPNKAKVPKPPAEKVKKEKAIKKENGEESGLENGQENGDETTNDISINDILNSSKKAATAPKSKQPVKPKKEKIKLTMDSDSEKSFDDEIGNIPVEFIERRQTGRQKKTVKYDLNSDDECASADESSFVTNSGINEEKPKVSTPRDLKKLDSDSDSESIAPIAKKLKEAKKKEQKKESDTPKAKATKSPVKPKAKPPQKTEDEKSESEVSWPSMDSDTDFEVGTSKLLKPSSKKPAATKKAPTFKKSPVAKPKADTKPVANNAKRIASDDDSGSDFGAPVKPKADRKPVAKKAKRIASDDESGSDFGASQKKKATKPKKKKESSDEDSDFSVD